MYKEFIKKEYERLFIHYKPKYKIGDKIPISRMSGKGVATIIGFEKFGNGLMYDMNIKWRNGGSDSRQQAEIKGFDEENTL